MLNPTQVQEIKALLSSESFSGESLVYILSQNPEIARNYSSLIGAWEDYTVGHHTVMVIGQFEKYFAKEIPETTSLSFWRMMLAMHDTGKYEAIQAGDKHRQHEFTLPIIEKVFTDLEFSRAEIDLAKEIVNGQGIGEYTRGRLSLAETASSIAEAAKRQNMTYSEFLSLMKIFWMCDAGAYTENAGGKESLDYMFDFVDGKCLLKPKYQKLYENLETISQ